MTVPFFQVPYLSFPAPPPFFQYARLVPIAGCSECGGSGVDGELCGAQNETLLDFRGGLGTVQLLFTFQSDVFRDIGASGLYELQVIALHSASSTPFADNTAIPHTTLIKFIGFQPPMFHASKVEGIWPATGSGAIGVVVEASWKETKRVTLVTTNDVVSVVPYFAGIRHNNHGTIKSNDEDEGSCIARRVNGSWPWRERGNETFVTQDVRWWLGKEEGIVSFEEVVDDEVGEVVRLQIDGSSVDKLRHANMSCFSQFSERGTDGSGKCEGEAWVSRSLIEEVGSPFPSTTITLQIAPLIFPSVRKPLCYQSPISSHSSLLYRVHPPLATFTLSDLHFPPLLNSTLTTVEWFQPISINSLFNIDRIGTHLYVSEVQCGSNTTFFVQTTSSYPRNSSDVILTEIPSGKNPTTLLDVLQVSEVAAVPVEGGGSGSEGGGGGDGEGTTGVQSVQFWEIVVGVEKDPAKATTTTLRCSFSDAYGASFDDQSWEVSAYVLFDVLPMPTNDDTDGNGGGGGGGGGGRMYCQDGVLRGVILLVGICVILFVALCNLILSSQCRCLQHLHPRDSSSKRKVRARALQLTQQPTSSSRAREEDSRRTGQGIMDNPLYSRRGRASIAGHSSSTTPAATATTTPIPSSLAKPAAPTPSPSPTPTPSPSPPPSPPPPTSTCFIPFVKYFSWKRYGLNRALAILGEFLFVLTAIFLIPTPSPLGVDDCPVASEPAGVIVGLALGVWIACGCAAGAKFAQASYSQHSVLPPISLLLVCFIHPVLLPTTPSESTLSFISRGRRAKLTIAAGVRDIAAVVLLLFGVLASPFVHPAVAMTTIAVLATGSWTLARHLFCRSRFRQKAQANRKARRRRKRRRERNKRRVLIEGGRGISPTTPGTGTSRQATRGYGSHVPLPAPSTPSSSPFHSSVPNLHVRSRLPSASDEERKLEMISIPPSTLDHTQVPSPVVAIPGGTAFPAVALPPSGNPFTPSSAAAPPPPPPPPPPLPSPWDPIPPSRPGIHSHPSHVPSTRELFGGGREGDGDGDAPNLRTAASLLRELRPAESSEEDESDEYTDESDSGSGSLIDDDIWSEGDTYATTIDDSEFGTPAGHFVREVPVDIRAILQRAQMEPPKPSGEVVRARPRHRSGSL